MTKWTAADVPDLNGRTAVVTGANTGIGFATAKLLAERGAAVVLACRDAGRAQDAAAKISTAAPGARVTTLPLDLASLSSVRAAAEQLHASHPRLDLLINNAGVITTSRRVTEDGYELTFATNHLGPFAFTGLVLDLLLPVPGSRVVTVSSIGHRWGRMHFDDLQLEHGFRQQTAYPQSKLANLLFTYQLQRRLATSGARTIAVAAHPGNAYTEIARELPGFLRRIGGPRMRALNWWLMQPAERAALATLRAAVDPDARGGEYYGPPGRLQFTGYPERVESSARSHDEADQQRLWAESERLTGVTFHMAAPVLP